MEPAIILLAIFWQRGICSQAGTDTKEDCLKIIFWQRGICSQAGTSLLEHIRKEIFWQRGICSQAGTLTTASIFRHNILAKGNL